MKYNKNNKSKRLSVWRKKNADLLLARFKEKLAIKNKSRKRHVEVAIRAGLNVQDLI